MADLNGFYANWTPRFLSVLRIIAGFLFVWHGSQKMFGFPPAAPMPGAESIPPLVQTMIQIAGVLEFFGGLLILVGLLTRPVAFLLTGLMAVAYFMAHAPQGFCLFKTAANWRSCIALCFCSCRSRTAANA